MVTKELQNGRLPMLAAAGFLVGVCHSCRIVKYSREIVIIIIETNKHIEGIVS
jgi:hypothetical protein